MIRDASVCAGSGENRVNRLSPEERVGTMASDLKERSRDFLAGHTVLLAYIRGIVLDPVLAEDLFQEVYVAMADAVERGVEIEDMARWCRGVARNLALRHWRSRRGSEVVVDPALLPLIDQAFDEVPDAAALDPEQDRRKAALGACSGELPPTSQRLLALKYREGRDIPAIAEILGRTQGAVLTALSRVRRALHQCIESRLRAAE
jgi:RNA polymerase sigma-70 factor, ECF subfamily